MPIYTLQELRARSGKQYKDLSDEEFVRKYSEYRGVPYEELADQFGIKPRGFVSEMGRQIAGGVMVEVPKMVGRAGQFISREMPWLGEAVEIGAKGQAATSPARIAAQDEADLRNEEILRDTGALGGLGRTTYEAGVANEQAYMPDMRNRGLVQQSLLMGARALAPVAATLPAAVVPGGMVAATGTLFGLSQAEDTYQKLIAEGVPEDEARAASYKTGAVQGLGEAAGTYLGMRAFQAARPIFGALSGRTTAGVAARAADTSILRPAATTFGLNLLGQPATEVAQDVATSMIESAAGGKPEDLGEIAKQSAMGAVGLTLLLGPLSFGSHVARSRSAAEVKAALAGDPAVAPERRAQIFSSIADSARSQGVGRENIGEWLQEQTAKLDQHTEALAMMEEAVRRNDFKSFQNLYNLPVDVTSPVGASQNRKEPTFGDLVKQQTERNGEAPEVNLLSGRDEQSRQFFAELRDAYNNPDKPSVWRLPVSTGLEQGSSRAAFAAGPQAINQPPVPNDMNLTPAQIAAAGGTPPLAPSQVAALRGATFQNEPRPATGTLSETQAMMAAGPANLPSAAVPVSLGAQSAASPGVTTPPGAFSTAEGAPSPVKKARRTKVVKPQPAPTSEEQGTLADALEEDFELADKALDAAQAKSIVSQINKEELEAAVQGAKSVRAPRRQVTIPQRSLLGIRDAILRKSGKVSKGFGGNEQKIATAARKFADKVNSFMNASNALRDATKYKSKEAEEKASEAVEAAAKDVSNALYALGQLTDNNAKNVEAIVRVVKDAVQRKLKSPGKASKATLDTLKSLDMMLSTGWATAKRETFMGERVDTADVSGQLVRRAEEQQEGGNVISQLEEAAEKGFKDPKKLSKLPPYKGLAGVLQYLSFNATTPMGKMLGAALREALTSSKNAAKVKFVDEGNSRYDPKTNTVFINRGEQSAEVVLHEAFHAALQWYVHQNPKAAEVQVLQRALDRALEAKNLTGKAKEVQDALKALTDNKRNLDAVLELVSYNATLNEFRRAMQELKSKEKTNPFWDTANKVWQAYKRVIRRLLGVPNTVADDILGASMSLLEKSAMGEAPAKMKGKPLEAKVQGDKAKEGVGSATTRQSRAFVERNIAKLPEPARGPARAIAIALGDVGGRALDKVMFTSSLINRAVALGMKSANAFQRALQQRDFAAREEERTIERVLDLYTKVPEAERGRGEGSVNRFLFDSTREGKWGYDAGLGEVDPDMAERFTALSDESQEFVRAVFSHGSQMLLRKRDIVLKATASEYDLQISLAKTPEEKAELQKAKKASLARYKTLFTIQGDKPYAPIKRTGNYVVVGKSAEYMDAEERGDTKELKKLQNDPDHYHVSFTDGKAAGADLRSQLMDQGAFADVQLSQRDVVVDELFSNEDALQQLSKLRADVSARAQTGDTTAGKMLELIGRMYLEALAETSARKSEMRRRGVDGEVDMIASFGTQGRADANFLASLQYGDKIRELMAAMKSESRTGDRTRKSEVFNELMRRYAQSLDVPENTLVNKLTRLSSLYFLTTSPAYYLQNLTQPFMMSVPAMAGEFSYAKVNKELYDAYTELGPIMKSAKLFTQQLDYSKVPDDVRDAISELVNRGRIDIGLETELGEFKVDGEGRLGKEWNRVDKGMRLLVQKGEAVNRLSTAIAAYRLAMSKPNATPEQAIDYADRILVETHGDYSRSNAPRPFNTALGKVTLQFRKFQLIQLSWYASMIKQAFTDPTQRTAALRSLGFALSHTAVLAGTVGLPGYAAIAWALGQLFGDDDEDFDLTDKIRKMIGDEDIANLVLRGAPTLAGADLSGKIGAGNMLSVLPYSNADLSTKAGFYEAVGTMLGGASAGMMARGLDGLGLLANGDYVKGMELLLPKGLGDVLKAYRLSTEGVTRRNADVLIPADEVSALDVALQGVGVQPAKMSVMYERQERVKAIKDKLDARTSEIKQKYVKAIKARDSEAAAEARAEWRKLQDAKKKAGLKRGSMSDLYKAPREQKKREKRTREGLQYTPATEGLVEDVTER